MKDNTIKVSLAVSKRIKTAKDLSDFYAYMERECSGTLEDMPTYCFAESEQERIDKLMGSINYEQGRYDDENVYRMLKDTYAFKKEEARNEAIELQYALSNEARSWEEIMSITDKQLKIGKRYGLLREFRENGVL